MTNIYKVKIDLKGSYKGKTPNFHEMDKAALEVELFDDGKYYDLKQATGVEFTHRLNDGTLINGTGTIDDVKSVVSYEYKGNEISRVGSVDVVVTVLFVEGKVTFPTIPLKVKGDIREGILTPANPYFGQFESKWQELKEEIANIKREVNLLNGITENTIFYDKFNRDDAEEIGNGWQQLAGAFKIRSGQVVASTTSGVTNVAVVDVVGTNLSIKAGLVTPQLSEGIMFRAIDTQNNFVALLESGNLLLNIRVNNVKTTLKSVTGVVTPGENYELRVDLNGDEIKIYVNNQHKMTYTDSRHAEGNKYGITSFNGGSNPGTFDNFNIETIN